MKLSPEETAKNVVDNFLSIAEVDPAVGEDDKKMMLLKSQVISAINMHTMALQNKLRELITELEQKELAEKQKGGEG